MALSQNPDSLVGKIIHFGKKCVRVVAVSAGVITGVLIANDASAQCPDTPDQVEVGTIDTLLDTGDSWIEVEVFDASKMNVDDTLHNSWGDVETEGPNSQIDYETYTTTGIVTIHIKDILDENSCNEDRDIQIVENLPLEILNFDVKVGKDSILYNYVTGSEINVNHVSAQVWRDGEKSGQFTDVKDEIYDKNVLGGRAHRIAIALEEFIDKSKAKPGETLIGRLKSIDNDGLKVFYKKVSFQLKADGSIDPESIIIYPNPATDQVELKNMNEKQEIKSIQVLDMQGKVLKTVENAQSIDVRDLRSGIYILRVTTEKGKVINKKLTISNSIASTTADKDVFKDYAEKF